MIEPETLIDGRYRVISRLGTGGMADVYLARDELLGRQMAVKVLHPHYVEDQEFVERFRREASSAAALSHPNIVAIFDRGEWNGTYYIAMEYVAGRSLKAIVREQGALEEPAALDIVIQILGAARFAHRRGVIHRDLKPHNVILDEDGRARVTDFGIARAGASDMTLTGSIMGTAQYLSPEQAQGFAVSAASDLYSVGVILYELLTGAVPFEGETAVAIAFKQVSAVPQPPSALNPALSPSLDAVVLRALAKDPVERYADDDELIQALEAELAALPGGGGSSPATGAVPASTRAAAADGYAAASASPPTGSMLLAPPPDERRAPREDRRRRTWLLWGLGVLLLAGALAALLLLLAPAKKVHVPRVIGLTEQAAGTRLRAAGLDSNPSLQASASVPAGLVISQSPTPGALLDKGGKVGIVISSGPATKALPSVEGLTVAQARSRLTKEGFKPSAKSQSSSTVKAGLAIGTDPPAGTLELVGSTVSVLVSSGPAPVKVPSLVGETLENAQATLASEGLSVGKVTQRLSGTQAPETVLSQSPRGGKTIKAGGAVDLVVAEAPKEAPVPNVVGQNEAAAAAMLGSAGFKVKTAPVKTAESSQVGNVLSQQPAGGGQAPKGSTVTIGVGVLGPTTSTGTTTLTTPPPPAGSGG